MDPPPAAELLERLRTQPRTARLLEAFAGVPGAHLVGGAVRDLLLGGEPLDLDVVVEGDGVAAARTAARALGGEVLVHERFGTASVIAPDVRFDVATARAEDYPQPGALPEVRPGTLEEDLARRDFTVNAIAVALGGQRVGEVHAHPGALDDLEARTLRVMHARSFLDDPTRLLRLVRYGARLGFEPDLRTDALARDAVGAQALRTVSDARVGGELLLLVGETSALAALTRASAIELDRAVHPSFDPRLDLAREAQDHVGQCRADLVVLAACCTRFEREELMAWLDRLEVRAPARDAVVAAALDSETLAERLAHAHRRSEVRHLASGRPLEELALAAALGAAEPVNLWLRELRHARLAIDGDDVVAAGVHEGPLVGRALEAAWTARLDDEVTDRDGQLAAALRAVEAHQ